ncbi:hypothetical protein [Bacillus piscicola]|uniref:hypothetical protein n=1 Tax=Bacillus piscicola TaxID=1632684 RepID=UPI001F0932BD|nr:hypothetical protein [Bacillus piscicola]
MYSTGTKVIGTLILFLGAMVLSAGITYSSLYLFHPDSTGKVSEQEGEWGEAGNS